MADIWSLTLNGLWAWPTVCMCDRSLDVCSAHDSDVSPELFQASWRWAASMSDWPIIQSDTIDSNSSQRYMSAMPVQRLLRQELIEVTVCTQVIVVERSFLVYLVRARSPLALPPRIECPSQLLIKASLRVVRSLPALRCALWLGLLSQNFN